MWVRVPPVAPKYIMATDKNEDQSYEFKLSLLGHEIFAVELKTTSTSDRWVAVTLISVFCSFVLLGAYGDKFVNIYRSMTATEQVSVVEKG